jgi:hypothetical protein
LKSTQGENIMSLKWYAGLCIAGSVTLGYLVTPGRADQWDKQTTFRFNQPVEVPGHVLVPGTYVFRLADLSSDRDVVQIFSEDKRGMDHLITTVMAIPTYLVKTPEKPEVTFEERRNNNPEAIHTWSYPGDNYGWEFLYPKAQNLQVAANTTPAPAISPAPAAPAPQPAVAQKAAPRPAAAPVTPKSPEPLIAQNHPPAAPSPVEPSARRELPKTASGLPLAAALGLLMLAGGVAVLGFGLLRSNV